MLLRVLVFAVFAGRGIAATDTSCTLAQNLCDLTSPHSDTTSDGLDTLVNCIGYSAKQKVFYLDLPAGAIFTIQQTANSFDSVHETRWGGSA